jgi:hypothetical protein
MKYARQTSPTAMFSSGMTLVFRSLQQHHRSIDLPWPTILPHRTRQHMVQSLRMTADGERIILGRMTTTHVLIASLSVAEYRYQLPSFLVLFFRLVCFLYLFTFFDLSSVDDVPQSNSRCNSKMVQLFIVRMQCARSAYAT